MKSFFLTFLLSSFYSLAHAGSLAMGQPCNPGNNRLQTGTFQFWSDCNSVTFCSDQGICENKGCRSDDFPFGYPKNSGDLPPKCPKGQFCPDEGSECQDILPVGSPCQLNRDGRFTFARQASTSSHLPHLRSMRRPTKLRGVN